MKCPSESVGHLILIFFGFTNKIMFHIEKTIPFTPSPMHIHFEQQLAEMERLMARRKQIIIKAALTEELETMRGKGKMMSDIMIKATLYNDPVSALAYVNAYLLPWRRYITSSHFPYTMETLPEYLPPSWTREEFATFIVTLSRALERDRAVLREMSFE